MRAFLYNLCLLFLSTTIAAQENTSCNVQIAFEHMVNNQILELGNTYHNKFGETFIPKSFKYYISDIGFADDSGKFYPATTECFLIDESEPESKRLALTIPPGKYKKLSFVIGVDSVRSVEGVHEGALDPYRGMFWTWNTGFIFAKFEGASPSSSMPQHLFQYDIGGFRVGQNSLRKIEIPIDNSFAFKTSENTLLSLKVDISKWFDGTNQLKIAQHPFVHTPGKLAMQYADNFAAMFTFTSLRSY